MRRYLLVEVWDGSLFRGGADGNGPDRGAPDDGGGGAPGQRPLRGIPLLIPSLQRPLGQGIIQHGHRRHLLQENGRDNPLEPQVGTRRRVSVPPSSCQLSTSLGSPREAGHSRSTQTAESIPFGIIGCGAGILGHLPARQSQQRVGHAALQSLTLNETTTTQKSSASRHPNIPKSCWEP